MSRYRLIFLIIGLLLINQATAASTPFRPHCFFPASEFSTLHPPASPGTPSPAASPLHNATATFPKADPRPPSLPRWFPAASTPLQTAHSRPSPCPWLSLPSTYY